MTARQQDEADAMIRDIGIKRPIGFIWCFVAVVALTALVMFTLGWWS